MVHTLKKLKLSSKGEFKESQTKGVPFFEEGRNIALLVRRFTALAKQVPDCKSY